MLHTHTTIGMLSIFRGVYAFLLGFPGGACGKEHACQCRKHKRCRFNPWVRKIPWRKAYQPTPVFLLGKCYGKRNLVGYSPWDHKESDMNEHSTVQFILNTLNTLRFRWWLRQQSICPQCRRPQFNPWVKKIPWRREWKHTPGFLSGEFHGQRSFSGYNSWGHKKSDMTKKLTFWEISLQFCPLTSK